MSARSEAAKAAWTDERREQQREVAKRLVAEGKFGGRQDTQGRGGRPTKRAPSGEKLLRVLEAQLHPGSWSWPGAQDVMLGRKLFAQIAPLLGLDRPHFESLLVSGIETVIADKQLAEFVLLHDDGTIVFPLNGVHPAYVLRDWRTGPNAQSLIVLRELASPDVRRYTDAEIVEALILLQFLSSRPLLQTSISVALSELATRVKVAVKSELALRAKRPS